MRWLMNSSPSISLRCVAGVCGLVALLSLSVVRAPAQDVEQRYQQAVQLFNSAKMEDAYELLQEVKRERPGYKETEKFLNIARKEIDRMYKMEETLFNQGVQFLNQGDYEGAKQKFDQAAKVPVKNPKYRSQISGYLSQIQSRGDEERLFQEGVKLFNDGNYSQAQLRLNQVAQGGGPKAGEARTILGKIDDTLRTRRVGEEMNKLFNEGVQLYGVGQNVQALDRFEKVANAGGPKAAEARTYIQRLRQISQATKETSKPPPGKEVAVVKPQVKPPELVASEQTLRAGLRAYFEGNINAAERDLSDYLDTKGPKQALAYFFRGAARSTRYLLSGEKDAEQKKLAVEDFRAFKSQAARLQPPEKFVSPKILTLYSEAVGAP
jgi:tetratricopeptide (TPR) repeat protein